MIWIYDSSCFWHAVSPTTTDSVGLSVRIMLKCSLLIKEKHPQKLSKNFEPTPPPSYIVRSFLNMASLWEMCTYWEIHLFLSNVAFTTCLIRAVASPSVIFPPTWTNGYQPRISPPSKCWNVKMFSPFQSEFSARKQWYFHRHHSRTVWKPVNGTFESENAWYGEYVWRPWISQSHK